MDYTVIFTTPSTGRTTVACATRTDVDNFIVDFLRSNRDENFTIELVVNV